ncbi:TolC family outer membrane protein [Sphingomonas adhaesiva]|uniref:TolC family outer membrane protein n=1 Tax=Sphingomonas adhaesiva TaxID=28212 RepID=UPI002FF922CE
MTRVWVKAALLLGSAAGALTPLAAQLTRPTARATQQPAAAPAATATTPAVAPRSTVATTVIAGPPVTGLPDRPAPRYAPDFGGKLSGLPYDKKAPVPAIAPIRTLAEAITLAYRTNPELLQARAQARSTDFGVPAARSQFGPQLGVSGAYTFTRTRQEVIPGTFLGVQGWNSSAQAVLSQPVWTFGRNASAAAGAVATAQFQRDALRVTEAQVMNDVVTAYVAVLRDAASVTIARENLALLNRQLDENQTRFEVRDLTLTDLDQTRTRVQLGQADLLQAEGQLGISQKVFLQRVGAPPGDLQPPDLLNITFNSLDGAYAFAEANSGLVRAAQSREKISRAAVAAARAEMGPRVDLRGTASYGSVSPYNDQLRTTNLVGQVVVTQPIIDSGLRRSRVGQAEEANQADWRLLDQTYRDTRQTVGAAWEQLAATRTSLANYRAAIDAAQRAYDGALIQQKAGDRSTLDVLNLARDLLTVRNSYNLTIASEYLARAGLLAAAGLLEGPQIVPGLTGYDDQDHYDRVRRRGDIPLLTPVLNALDNVTTGNLTRDRPVRDAGAEQAIGATMPLPAPDPVTKP